MTGNRALAAGSNGQRRLGFDVGGIRFTCDVDDSRFDRLERHLRSYLHTVATTRRSAPVDIAVRFDVRAGNFACAAFADRQSFRQ